MTASLFKRAIAETIGTALLLAIVVGSGVMADRLAVGNDAVALLGNTVATGAGLVVLILIFGPISGAHFNPAVSVVTVAQGSLSLRDGGVYAVAQCVGALVGVWLAHVMFGLDLIQASGRLRSSFGELLGEAVATFCLILAILSVSRSRPDAAPFAVGFVVVAGYWFTSSTSFANPAVTLARAFTDTFAGIRLLDVPGFVLGQALGATAALAFYGWLFSEAAGRYRPVDAGAVESIPGARRQGRP